MVITVLSEGQKRESVELARCARDALPFPAAMQRAAVEHLRQKSGVGHPMRAGRPRVRDFFREHVLRVAARGLERDQAPYTWSAVIDAAFEVPVRIDTRWGPVEVRVKVRPWPFREWTCCSPALTERSLAARAAYERWRFLLLVLPDDRSARAVAAGARAKGVLRWDLCREEDDEESEAWSPLRDDRVPWPTVGSRVGRAYRETVRAIRAERVVTSDTAVALTRGQASAWERLRTIVMRPWAQQKAREE